MIQKISKFVCTRLDQLLSINGLAEAVHVSASHLPREFRAWMGISLDRFMTQARLNHALS